MGYHHHRAKRTQAFRRTHPGTRSSRNPRQQSSRGRTHHTRNERPRLRRAHRLDPRRRSDKRPQPHYTHPKDVNDQEPQVAFTAATTLWKMNDHSGEDILVAVVNGDRKATATLKDSSKHTISKALHSPSTLARIAALQGASLLLGPFGFGVGAYEYMHKNGVDTSRVTAVEQISEEK